MHGLRMIALGAAMLAACSHAKPEPVAVPAPVEEVAPVATPEVSLGVPADNITAISFGEERPKMPGHDEESWRGNRRDDVFVKAAPALSAR